MTSTIIPAHPGYFYLILTAEEYDDEEACLDLQRLPIVAWRTSGDNVGVGEPITIGDPRTGERSLSQSRGVLCPDGRVIELDGMEYDTLKDWRAHNKQFFVLLLNQKRASQKAA